MKTSKFQIAALAALSTLVLTTLHADALQLGPGESDVLAVFDAAGALITSVSADELTEDPTAVHTIPDPTFADPAKWGLYTMVLEPLEEGGGISDYFGVVDASGTGAGPFLLGFMSDGEGVPPDPSILAAFFGPGPAAFTVTEDATTPIAFPATFYLPVGGPAASAEFISDVPEPSTYAAVVALGSLAGWRLLRRRKA